MYGYIYLTTNIINDKKYIGRKKSNEFLGDKYLGSGTYIKNAINKYGRENFKVELIKECNSDIELYESEVEYIKLYDAVNSDKFYNQSPGGRYDGFVCGDSNISRLPHNRARQSELVRNLNKKNKDDLAKSRIGHYVSEETKRKISESNKGKRSGIKASEETRLKMSKAHKGKKLSEETKLKCSIHNKGKRLGMKASEETILRLKDAQSDRKWINNGKVSKKVKSEDLEYYYSIGFKNGRLPKRSAESSTTIESIT